MSQSFIKNPNPDFSLALEDTMRRLKGLPIQKLEERPRASKSKCARKGHIWNPVMRHDDVCEFVCRRCKRRDWLPCKSSDRNSK